ncbi:MAG TPA: oligopeptide/dipeptide ABC transporter ATP-binding protein [Devosiaceae bacterium]|jgi:oligopeptide/dipeptide ABC transporter ATP-binding protein
MNKIMTAASMTAADTEAPLLVVESLTRRFAGRRSGIFGQPSTVHAVDNVGFTIRRGETLGLVGESGSGKSTIGKLVARILAPSSGRVLFDGHDLAGLDAAGSRELTRQIQVIFQDTLGALNPRLTIGHQVREGLDIHQIGDAARRDETAKAMLAKVGLAPELFSRYPHELSGGQRQRVVMARVLLLEPTLIVCDEPVSALDVSVQAQVINFLEDLQKRHGLAYLFISHDLRVVRQICDRVAVLYLGRIVEQAPRTSLFQNPRHPYTRSLIDAVPIADPDARHRTKTVAKGEPPSPLAPPSGCHFHTRCPFAVARCSAEVPAVRTIGLDHSVACHRVDELELAA